MNQPANFFAEFPPVSKEEWLARVTKDLKGKPLDDLHWHLNAEITVDPFGHADDWPLPRPILFPQAGAWEISEDVEEQDTVAANAQALEALNFGAGSLHFQVSAGPFPGRLHDLLNGIYLDHISLHFSGAGVQEAPAAMLAALKDSAQGISSQQLHGSLFYDPAEDTGRLRDWRYVADLLHFAQAEFPGFRCLTVDGRPAFGGPASAADELAALLRRGQTYFEHLTERGLTPDKIAGQLQFSLYTGKSYFVEIAKLRAFKILWANFLKAWGAKPVFPVLDIRFSPGEYTDDLYTNMIRATTMAMSAILGGANRLTVLPYDAGWETAAVYPRAFARRVARNVQHLLQLESGFADLTDPAAGSYYLEKLTTQLSLSAWKQFQEA